MVIKKSLMKEKTKSSIKGLINYLTKEKTNIDIRNAGVWFGTNEYEIEDIDLYIKDIIATQKANVSSDDDKTYHLIVSFPHSERPGVDILKKIEKDIMKSLNFEEHQRICVLHDDTDNFHFHIAVNKINPYTLKINTPYRDYQKLGDIASKIEKKYNLTATNHIKNITPYNKNQDMERAGFIQNLGSYIKNINLEDLKSWNDFHLKLNEAGIIYIKKGAGAVFGTSDNKIFIKASTVNNKFSLGNLEKVLGNFEKSEFKNEYIKSLYKKTAIDNNELYESYKAINNARKAVVKEDRDKINSQYDIKITRSVNLLKNLMEVALLAEAGYLEKLIIRKYFYGEIKDKREKLHNEKKELLKKVYQNNPFKPWKEWLVEEAKTNVKAENYLYREQEKQNMFLGEFDTLRLNSLIITKNGTTILTKDLRVTRNALFVKSRSKILKNLLFYQDCHSEPLKIHGTDIFKNSVIDVILSNGLNIALDDINLQNKLDKLKSIREEKTETLLEEFNNFHNDKMYKYLPYEKQETCIYKGFIKHNDQFFILLKSEMENTFFVKEPVSKDYKIIKENNLKKGDNVSFKDFNKRNNFILDDYLDIKEQERLKYIPLGGRSVENMILYGEKEFKDHTILLYKQGNLIFSKIVSEEDREKQKIKNREQERIKNEIKYSSTRSNQDKNAKEQLIEPMKKQRG